MTGRLANFFGARATGFAFFGAPLLALGVFFHAHYRLSIVAGESMLPTFHNGDILLVDRRAYDGVTPERGDVVVARYGGDWVVKRVVALPGEEAEVRSGALYINARAMRESYSLLAGPLDVERGTLLEGDFATLGDNRSVPRALAVHPIVSAGGILGKVIGNVRLARWADSLAGRRFKKF